MISSSASVVYRRCSCHCLDFYRDLSFSTSDPASGVFSKFRWCGRILLLFLLLSKAHKGWWIPNIAAGAGVVRSWAFFCRPQPWPRLCFLWARHTTASNVMPHGMAATWETSQILANSRNSFPKASPHAMGPIRVPRGAPKKRRKIGPIACGLALRVRAAFSFSRFYFSRRRFLQSFPGSETGEKAAAFAAAQNAPKSRPCHAVSLF